MRVMTRTRRETWRQAGARPPGRHDGPRAGLFAGLFAGLAVAFAPPIACAPSPDTGLPTERVASEFVFAEHAFSFPNWGGPVTGDGLDADAMTRMFGKTSVCNPDVAGACALLPIAKQYMGAVNRSLRGGRCEGFAVLSGLAARGEVDLGSFGAAEAASLSIDDNAALRRELAYWFATQYLRDVVPTSTLALSGPDAVRYLASELGRTDHPMFRIGLARIDPETGALSGGHAVLATYVAPGAREGLYEIGIYDNNLPEAERRIEVDATAGSWRYEASPNPETSSVVYQGDPDNQNFLYLSPVEPRLGVHPCTFCNAEEGEEVLAQIFGSAGVELIAEHPTGARTGESDGQVSTDHDEGHATPIFTTACTDCRDGIHGAFPHHPEDGVQIELRQSVHAPTLDGVVEDLSADYFGHGFHVSVEGADVLLGEVHTLIIAGHGAAATYLSDDPAPDDRTHLTVAHEFDDGEQVLVRARVGAADLIDLEVDRDTGDPVLLARGQVGAEPARVQCITTRGEQTSSFTVDVDLPPQGEILIRLDASEAGGEVEVWIDEDGDGLRDEVLRLPDLGVDA